jgi:hypothetical protein
MGDYFVLNLIHKLLPALVLVGVGRQSQVLAFSFALIGVANPLPVKGEGATFSLGWIPKILSARV